MNVYTYGLHYHLSKNYCHVHHTRPASKCTQKIVHRRNSCRYETVVVVGKQISCFVLRELKKSNNKKINEYALPLGSFALYLTIIKITTIRSETAYALHK